MMSNVWHWRTLCFGGLGFTVFLLVTLRSWLSAGDKYYFHSHLPDTNVTNPAAVNDADFDLLRSKVAFLESKSPKCRSLQNGDKSFTDGPMESSRYEISASTYLLMNCSEITRGLYITDRRFLSDEEVDFPLAFQLLVYTDVWQFERLFQAIYRPQNFYCVHVDLRSPRRVNAAINRKMSCFSNVFAPSQRHAVDYGGISQLDAELSCMRELSKRSDKWKYLINLTGQEWPMKTMWQLVRILAALNGSNAMEGSLLGMNKCPDRRDQLMPFALQHNLVPIKGQTHFAVVRAFALFVLHNPVSIALHEWLKDAPNPDETLLPTLNHNPSLKAPGAFLGFPESDPDTYPYITRLKVWHDHQVACFGYFRNGVCVWGVAGLPFLTNATRKGLFLNKVFWNFEGVTLDCLELWHWKKTLTELEELRRGGLVQFDVSYYSQLLMTRLHIP